MLLRRSRRKRKYLPGRTGGVLLKEVSSNNVTEISVKEAIEESRSHRRVVPGPPALSFSFVFQAEDKTRLLTLKDIYADFMQEKDV